LTTTSPLVFYIFVFAFLALFAVEYHKMYPYESDVAWTNRAQHKFLEENKAAAVRPSTDEGGA
jgi:hypothetical protein